MNSPFPNVKKNLGFGCMRLPMKGNQVDYEEFSKMVDKFLAEGFNYFDTAHGYLGGLSEIAIRECLVKRHPRDSYILVDKLTDEYFKKEEDIVPFFNSQLEACGVDYFDFYLMHSQNAKYFVKYQKCHAYETALKLKAEGKIKHFGISFHDNAEVLEMILKAYPEIEVVQIQFNYADYDDPGIQAKACYDVCVKYGKPVIVMEPVKGGLLSNLPPEAKKVITDLKGGSEASYAIRYAAGFDQIYMVLSGMSNLEQLNENVSYMKDFKPLDETEKAAVEKVRKIYKSLITIPCTACHYCTAGCPKQIPIPEIFACLNQKKIYKDWNSDWYYNVYTTDKGKAKDCIKCGKCEGVCPQHLHIRDFLVDCSKVFD